MVRGLTRSFVAGLVLSAVACGSSEEPVKGTSVDGQAPPLSAEQKARIERLQQEFETVSTALHSAGRREMELRSQILERAKDAKSYEEVLTDEDSKALIAKINAMTDELNALKEDLKKRMEASEDYKTRDDALRTLHTQIVDVKAEKRKLQQEQGRLEIELKKLGVTVKAASGGGMPLLRPPVSAPRGGAVR